MGQEVSGSFGSWVTLSDPFPALAYRTVTRRFCYWNKWPRTLQAMIHAWRAGSILGHSQVTGTCWHILSGRSEEAGLYKDHRRHVSRIRTGHGSCSFNYCYPAYHVLVFRSAHAKIGNFIIVIIRLNFSRSRLSRQFVEVLRRRNARRYEASRYFFTLVHVVHFRQHFRSCVSSFLFSLQNYF